MLVGSGVRTTRNAGYATITGPWKNKEEFDTCTCKHCSRAWVVRSNVKGKANPGGWCSLCARMVCPTCVGKECVPFMIKLKMFEDRQALGEILGT